MYPNQRPKKKSNELVNEFIPYRFKNIRVVFPDGRSQVLSRDEGLRQAEALGLDLYCISPNGNPPVCKILNYSKYLFEKKKKEKHEIGVLPGFHLCIQKPHAIPIMHSY